MNIISKNNNKQISQPIIYINKINNNNININIRNNNININIRVIIFITTVI